MENKIFSKTLYRRLLRFSRPYSIQFILALILSLVIVCLELSVPVITRYLVDNHITARYHLVTAGASGYKLYALPEKAVIRLDAKTSALRHDRIEYLPPSIYSTLQQNGQVSEDLYYITPVTDSIKEADMDGVSIIGRYCVIRAKALSKLSHSEIITLRGNDIRMTVYLGFLIIALIAISFICTYSEVYLVTWAGQHVIHDMRMALYAHVVRLPMTYFDTHKSGRIVTRLTNDINNIEEFFTAVFINLFKDVFIITGIVSVLLFLDFKLGLVILILLPVIVGVSLFFRKRMRRAFRLVRDSIAGVNARLSETITGITLIQQYNREKRYSEKFADDNNRYFRAAKKQVLVNSLFNPIISIIRFSGIGIVVYAGSLFVIGGGLSLGTLIVFIAYLQKFFQPIQDIAEKINIMQSAMASSERIFSLLDEGTEYDTDSTLTYDDLMSRSSEYFIEFDNVTFGYSDNEPVLKNFSMKVRRGESVALVGHTGCGKTTTISLLSRLYSVTTGEIRVQGIPVNTIPLAVLRQVLGVVQQDVTLFSDTIQKNILLSADGGTEYLDQVCEYTNCSRFICNLPDGYDTVLSEEGMSLSFGQRQLISFARVIAYDPDVFILDEATSNIDTETELLIQDALNRILENKTSIVIAHRLSTIKHCDRIIVMRHGEIIEQGKHDSLIEKEGTYYRLYKLQYENILAS